MAWKYVTFRDKDDREFPVIFPAEMVHLDVARAIQSAVRHSEVKGHLREYSCPKPISAGMIASVRETGLGGESETLELKSRQLEDSHLIRTYNLTRGVMTP